MPKALNIYEAIESCAQTCFDFGFNRHVPRNEQGDRLVSAREIIDNHKWGTHGKDGTEPLKTVLLVGCETDHLRNILRTQPQISALTTLVIMAILMERDEVQKLSNFIKISSKSIKSS